MMKAFTNSGYHISETNGMDLRDYFAANVMQAILTGTAWSLSDPDEVSAKAYVYADAMMKAREG